MILTKYNPQDLLRYGNELEICGFLTGNGTEQQLIMFPDTPYISPKVVCPTDTEYRDILRQMDILEIETSQKVILRKSQRQIDMQVSWNVFRRDDYTCRYCGRDDVPLTVDHIVLWEDGGETLEDNLISSCRRCNKTRGNMPYLEWLQSDYYKRNMENLSRRIGSNFFILNNEAMWEKANKTPLRKTMRSR